VRQIARQLVQIDERLGREHEVETALELLEAEATLGKVLVQLRSKAFPVSIGRPWPRRAAALGACS
jgi:hypothetical protein